MSKTVKINKQSVPVEDVLAMKLVCVSDQLFTEIRYRQFEPCYHEVTTLVPRDKAYQIEKTVRRAMCK